MLIALTFTLTFTGLHLMRVGPYPHALYARRATVYHPNAGAALGPPAFGLAAPLRGAAPLLHTTFPITRPGEAVATILARCTSCSWGTPGREAASVKLFIDGKYSQHLLLFRGQESADYRVGLGRLDARDHQLTITLDDEWTPRGVAVTIDAVRVQVPESPVDQLALAHAPILHARPDTIGRFTDVPLLSWYEAEPIRRPTRLRYGVVFSNEDGGTPTDRLMATWGRATDIEYVYWIDIDERGGIRAAGFEGPGHEIRSFAGKREHRHPLLWVATLNNMIEDSGKTGIRFRVAPVMYDLTDTSRETVMDAEPWTYQVMAQEIGREGKIESAAAAGSGRIPDPRSFLYIEACGELTNAALAFSINAPDRDGHDRWLSSDQGLPEFRIARSGCFRAAIPIPGDLDVHRITSVRARAFPRPPSKAAPPPESFQARLTRVNKVFALTSQHVPGVSLLSWQGDAVLDAANPVWIAKLR